MREITDAVLAGEFGDREIRCLDAGCGTGYNLLHFSGRWEMYGIDLASVALEAAKHRDLSKLVRGSVVRLPFASESFEFLLSFEVITQTPYELHEQALAEFRRVLKPGGRVLLRVPAYRWLWSSHDEQLEVRYRYTRGELVRRVRQCGFTVEWSSYANGLLFPVVLVHRLLKRLGVASGSDVRRLPRSLRWLEEGFRRTLAAEAAWHRARKRLPFGSSVLCYARR